MSRPTPMSAATPLIFMHIPRTGGLTLLSGLAEEYGTSIADMYGCTVANPGPAMELLSDLLYRCYCGFFSFGLHHWLGRPARYISIVRQPVRRLIALYSALRPIRQQIRRAGHQQGESISALIKAGKIADAYQDFLDWIEDDFEKAERFFDSPAAELDNGMVRRFSGHGLTTGPCPEAALHRAQRNIERCFSVVGVFERYQQTLDLLGSLLEMPGLRQIWVPEMATDKPLLDGSLVELIDRNNRLDLALYDWIVARFEALCAGAPQLAVVVPGAEIGDKAAPPPLWKAVGPAPRREVAIKLGGLHLEEQGFGGAQVMPPIV